jgi:hypothetical protein
MKGILEYSHMKKSVRRKLRAETVDLDASTTLVSGSWISEPVLWMHWQHTGRLVIRENGIAICLNATKFQNAAELFPDFKWVCTHYAGVFMATLRDARSPLDVIHASDVKRVRDALEDGKGSTRDSRVGAESVEIQMLPWKADLPAHISSHVCQACVKIARRIAIDGLDENRPHHGFIIIVGDPNPLDTCGRSGFNPFSAQDVFILDDHGVVSEEVFEIMRRNAFHTDGAVVIDGLSGRVIASGWFVGDITSGGAVGGARTRSAKAVAQQAGGCFVIKCSEDSVGELDLHLGAVVETGSGEDSVMECRKYTKFNCDVAVDVSCDHDSFCDLGVETVGHLDCNNAVKCVSQASAGEVCK